MDTGNRKHPTTVKGSRLDRWLVERLGKPPTLARPVLLLCSNDDVAHSAKAWAARQRGYLGLEIRTLRALARQLDGPWLGELPDDVPLPDHPELERIRMRPGLLAMAQQHARAYRLAREVSEPQVASWLRELGDSGYDDDTRLERRLLALARQNGPKLTPAIRFHRVVTLGFEGPLPPWERAMLEALGTTTHEDPARSEPDRALEVGDPAAEARLAVQLAAEAPYDTLVLVQHPATANRVHRALLRNGLPSALRRTHRLDRHTLASVVRRCVGWFSGAADPAIRAVDLHEVLRHPMVGDHLPEVARAWLEDRLEPLRDPDASGDEPVYTGLSARGIANAIRRARHLHAPLSAWMREVEALSHRTDDKRLAADSAGLLARLKVLDACVRGVHVQDAFPVEAPVDDPGWGDFDALIANLVDEEDLAPEEPMPTPGTLGCLRKFLLACRIRTLDDPAARAILGALRNAVDRPATHTDLLQVLAGSADREEIRNGVQILAYEDYDGRPCERLLLLDVHDQGLAARPKRDPLLSPSSLRSLGLLDPTERVDRRLDQLRRACAQASQSIAIVARHDIMGRALVPPIQLRLPLQPAEVGAYGLTAPIPEAAERRVLEVLQTDTPPDPVGLAGHLAVQASTEWSRHGRGATEAPLAPRAPGAETLAHRLHTMPLPATWMRPWLGDARHAEEAHLGERPRSASSFFKPLSHCLYQAFVKNQLRIEEPDDVGEELDAREIGNAVHDALEQVATLAAWSASGDLAAIRASFEEQLARATERSFEKARDTFGALSPARLEATRGLERRWRHHWNLYCNRRVQHAQENRSDLAAADRLVYQHRFVDNAAAALAESGRLAELAPLPPSRLRYWVLDASKDLVVDDRPARFTLGEPWRPVLEGFLKHPAFERVCHLRWTAMRLTMAARGPVLASAAEIPFGPLEDASPSQLGLRDETVPVTIEAMQLELGSQQVAVWGKIDRVDVVAQRDGPLARIVDYKTGRNAPSEPQGLRYLLRLVEPQLVIYALVLRQALRDQELPEPLKSSTVATVGWDHPRAVKGETQLEDARDAYPLDDGTLDLLARAIGALVGRAQAGEWLLHPNPDTCPQLTSWGHDHCPYAGACRFKAHGDEG